MVRVHKSKVPYTSKNPQHTLSSSVFYVLANWWLMCVSLYDLPTLEAV